jgi:hypothetical protein
VKWHQYIKTLDNGSFVRSFEFIFLCDGTQRTHSNACSTYMRKRTHTTALSRRRVAWRSVRSARHLRGVWYRPIDSASFSHMLTNSIMIMMMMTTTTTTTECRRASDCRVDGARRERSRVPRTVAHPRMSIVVESSFVSLWVFVLLLFPCSDNGVY